jgi:nitroreductase
MQASLYETIYNRKSIRKYDLKQIEPSTLTEIESYIDNLSPLYEGIKTQFKIVSQNSVSGLFSIKAPHYILVSSETSEGYLTNAGFMLQQLDLYFSANGIGSCWQGMAKPTKEIAQGLKYEFVIAIAFGYPADNLHRDSILAFKRKQINQIRDSSDLDELLEAARIAPSASNGQPWFFKVGGGTIHAYCVKSNLLKAMMYEKMNKIDMGIAFCHIWLAAKHLEREIEFIHEKGLENNPPKGYYYTATIKIK